MVEPLVIPIDRLDEAVSVDENSNFVIGPGLKASGQLVADFLADLEQVISGRKIFDAGKLIDKGSVVYDVRAYGFLGDGVYNDSLAINAAIQAANAAGGGKVLVPEAVANIKSTIVPRSNVHLMGMGMGVTELKAPTTSPVSMIVNSGNVAGEQFVENFTISNMTLNMNSKAVTGFSISYFRNCEIYGIEWKNLLCTTASRWVNKFGTIGSVDTPEGILAAKSRNLKIHHCIYRDNYTKTLETLLLSNVASGEIYSNYFTNNSTNAPLYDEVSLFIYNDDIDYHDNLHYNSKNHGVGTKESERTKIHDNTFIWDSQFVSPSSYFGVRNLNSKDATINENTIVCPDLVTASVNIVATGETITRNPGAWNESTTSNTTRMTLLDITSTNLYVGQKVYSSVIPEGASILLINSSTEIVVSNIATGLGAASVSFGHFFGGVFTTDRTIGFDGHPQRNFATRNLSIVNNKIRNAYYGVGGAYNASLGVDVVARCNVSGSTITLLDATFALDHTNYTVTENMTEYLFAEEKVVGTVLNTNTQGGAIVIDSQIIADNTKILSVDSENQITLDTPALSNASNVLIYFDTNLIRYRGQEIYVEDNKFVGTLAHAVYWGVDDPDMDIQNLFIKRNYIGEWRGTNNGVISIHGYRTDPTKFKKLYIDDNYIGKNIEGTNNCGIRLDAVIAESVNNNIIPEYGTLGRISATNSAIIGGVQNGFLTYTANKTLSFETHILADATSATFSLILPDPALYIGKEYEIIKIDSTTRQVILDPTGANTINGASTYTLRNQFESATVRSNGVQWYVMGSSRAAVGLQQAFDTGQTITFADASGKQITITNSDVTNNLDTVTINNSGTGHGHRVNQNGVLASNKNALFIDSNAIQTISALARIRQQNASSTKSALQLSDAGSGGALEILLGNIVLNTTGTKIGTATSQKFAFWNATPVVQPTTSGAAATFAANSSGIANDTATYDGYTIGQIIKALRTIGLLA